MTLPLPPVTLRDIGKASGGATAADVLTEIVNGIVGGLTKMIADLAGSANDLLKGSLKGAGDATKGAEDALKGAAGGATDAAKDAAKSLKKLFK